MSKMTSSICINTMATAPSSGQHNQQSKTLTNFSIDSIIGLTSQRESQQQSPVVVDDTDTQLPDSRLYSAHVMSDNTCYTDNNDKQQIKKYRPKNFQCFVCQMAFSNNGQLKNHVRIHTGERPFRCSERTCGKTFTRNEELTRHKLIHTGVRPHACPNCNKTFGRKDHLKKHLRTHERKKRVYAPSARLRSYLSGHNQDMFQPLKSQPPTPKTIRKMQTNRPNDNTKLASTSLAAIVNLQQQQQHQFSAPQPAIPLPPMPNLLASHQHEPDAFTTAFLGNQIASLAALNSTIAMTSTINSVPISTTLPIDHTSNPNQLQQLAGSYWQKWYNFINYQQQQQQQKLCHPKK